MTINKIEEKRSVPKVLVRKRRTMNILSNTASWDTNVRSTRLPSSCQKLFELNFISMRLLLHLQLNEINIG